MQTCLTPLATAVRVLALGVVVACANPVVQAAETRAEQGAERTYDIAPGSLDSVLGQFGQQAGVMVAVDSQHAQGLNSPGLRGRFELDQALARLIAGTGLQAVAVGPGRYRLIPQAAESEALELGATSINAAGLGATTEGTGSYTTGATSTATKMNLSIRETPQSISVITRQRMDDQQLHSMSEVLNQTPGITMSQDGGERFNIYSRGSAINTYQFDGVTTYQENQTRNMPSTLMDMAIYDRVEVVRGATGLMTGAGDPSGVVNVIRKRPTHEFQAYVQGGVGSWDYKRLEADVSGPLTPTGNLRGRMVAAKQLNNTFMDWYQQDRDILYGVLEADFTDSTVVRLSIDHQRYRPTGAQGVPMLFSNGQQTDFSRSTSSGARWNSDRFDTNNYTLGIEQQLANDWQLKVAATYMEVDRDTRTGSYQSSTGMSYITPEGIASISQSWSEANQRQKAIDATLQGPFELFGQTHELIVGSNYLDYVNHHYATTGSPALVDFYTWNNELPKPDKSTFSPTLDYDVDTRQSGYFVASRFNLSDQLHLILGARASNYHYHYYSKSLASGFTMDYGMTERGEVTPYAGVVYDLTAQQSVYASYTDIFKPQSSQDRTGKTLEPVVGKNYELGWKGEFYDGRLNANVAAYLVKRDNVAELDAGFTVPGTDEDAYRAVSGAKTKGVDLELSGELAPGWELQTGYSHSRTEDAEGERLTTQLPLDTFRLWTTYQLPGQWQRLTVGGGASWNSSNSLYFSRYNSRVGQDDYAVVNLMARYRFTDHLSSSLNLNNLLDEKYYSGFSGSYGHYGPPRNLMMDVRYDF
ncbi:TonB-dependent receptor [Pseudomonas sp. GD03860]|uniref:TonB-dependent siderophore receptor n=1 Tax=Pseudomonas TaxID=286 RepID=UPI002364970C|nr:MULTISPECIES: TonB-dependent receptor [Pseudomonas]MDD2056476.1 TonB-dependent receptor [Pseudomonas putida]MDH0638825.1 TonB-dependent receptor [Pseudomonas sp. GD03860]